MKSIRSFIDEISVSTDTIRKELEGQQGDLVPLLNDELLSIYYNDLT